MRQQMLEAEVLDLKFHNQRLTNLVIENDTTITRQITALKGQDTIIIRQTGEIFRLRKAIKALAQSLDEYDDSFTAAYERAEANEGSGQ